MWSANKAPCVNTWTISPHDKCSMKYQCFTFPNRLVVAEGNQAHLQQHQPQHQHQIPSGHCPCWSLDFELAVLGTLQPLQRNYSQVNNLLYDIQADIVFVQHQWHMWACTGHTALQRQKCSRSTSFDAACKLITILETEFSHYCDSWAAQQVRDCQFCGLHHA